MRPRPGPLIPWHAKQITISDQNFGGMRISEDQTEQENNRQPHIMVPATSEKKDPRAWDALTPPLAQWILDAINAMGLARMTPVQASTIPLFMGNKDVVVEVRALIVWSYMY